MERLVVRLRDGQVWARAGYIVGCDATAKDIVWRAETQDLDQARFAAILDEETAKLGLPLAGRNLFDDNTRGELLLAIAVDDIEARFCVWTGDPVSLIRGEMTMQLEWQVYDPLQRSVIATFKTQTGSVLKSPIKDGLDYLIHAAFRENVRALLDRPDYREVVLAPAGVMASATAQLSPLRIARAPRTSRTVNAASLSVVSIMSDRGHGSGFLIAPTGEVLTNAHVVGQGRYVKVRWNDGAETLGEVLRRDTRRDVALVKIPPPTGRAPLALVAAKPESGTDVYAIGTPLDEGLQGTVTRGVVSAVRELDGLNYIQSDVTVNPGNSGGPLIDKTGAVIAITVAAYQPDAIPTGINLFIPIADALAALNIRIED